jgi:hypothetical protein
MTQVLHFGNRVLSKRFEFPKRFQTKRPQVIEWVCLQGRIFRGHPHDELLAVLAISFGQLLTRGAPAITNHRRRPLRAAAGAYKAPSPDLHLLINQEPASKAGFPVPKNRQSFIEYHLLLVISQTEG